MSGGAFSRAAVAAIGERGRGVSLLFGPGLGMDLARHTIRHEEAVSRVVMLAAASSSEYLDALGDLMAAGVSVQELQKLARAKAMGVQL